MMTHDSLTAPRHDPGSLADPTGADGGGLGNMQGPFSVTAQQAALAPSRRDRRRWVFSPVMIVFVSANAVLLALAMFAIASFGSIRLAVGHYLRGERLLVDAAQKSFGAAAPGETVRVSFKLTNRNDGEIRILGCRADCNCAVPRDLPFALRPNESRDFALTIQLPRKGKGAGGTHLDLPFTLFTSSEAQPRVNLAVRGELGDEPPKVLSTP